LIAFIHGPDRLLAREAALAFATRFDPDGSNTTWFDARESGTDQLIGAIGAASFFGAPRVVIVSNLVSRTTREAKGASTDAASRGRSSGANAELEALLAAVPDQNCLVLFEPEMDAPPAAIKSAKPPMTIVAGEPPRGAALVAWIEGAAGRAGARIDRRTAQFLAETLFPQTWDRKPANPRYDHPPDLALLSQEIEKLALATHPDPISRDHVLALVPGGPDQRVFRFLDAAINGELRAAIGELERLTNAGEEPAMLLAQMLGQVELAAVATKAGGRDANSVSRDLGSITPARMSAVMSSAQRRRLPVDESLAGGAMIDRNLKTGRIRRPEDALQHLLLALAAPASARETGRSR
jgi:DNA polymerase III delta subunit